MMVSIMFFLKELLIIFSVLSALLFLFDSPCGKSDKYHLLPVTWHVILPPRLIKIEHQAETFLGSDQQLCYSF